MTHRPADDLDPGRKLLLAAAGIAAVAVPLTIGMMNARPIRAQQPPAAGRLTFEVASVKANSSRDMRNSSMRIQPGGRVTIMGIPLYHIVSAAYHIPSQFNSPRLSGGPDWIRTEAFDIEAVPPAGAITSDLSGPERDAKIRQMLQALLADRFKLQVRHEAKEIPVYAITMSKNGLKLKQSSVTEEACRAGTAGVPCHRLQGGMGRGLHSQAVNMTDISSFVENWTDRPMVDQSGLTGLYEVDTEGWVPMIGRPRGEGPEAEALNDPTRPTLFQVFEKMGLKLEPKKAPVEVYIIEHAEKPAAN